jgi:hypothetical protein
VLEVETMMDFLVISSDCAKALTHSERRSLRKSVLFEFRRSVMGSETEASWGPVRMRLPIEISFPTDINQGKVKRSRRFQA